MDDFEFELEEIDFDGLTQEGDDGPGFKFELIPIDFDGLTQEGVEA